MLVEDLLSEKKKCEKFLGKNGSCHAYSILDFDEVLLAETCMFHYSLFKLLYLMFDISKLLFLFTRLSQRPLL